MNKHSRLTEAIKSASSSIKKAMKLGEHEGADPICAHVYANAYYYERKIAALKKSAPLLKALPSQKGIPFIFTALWNLFKKQGFCCDREILKEGLKGYDFNSYELDMLGLVINAAAIIETSLVCESAIKDKSYSVKRLQTAHSALKKADLTDFTVIYKELSSIEAYLYENEPYFPDMTEETKAMYRKALRAYAKKIGLSEKEALKKAHAEAKANGCCIGHVLKLDKHVSPVGYTLFSLFVFAAVFTACLLLCPTWSALLLAIPLGAFSLATADFCFSIKAVSLPCPSLAPEKIKEDKLALTVITTLLDEDCKAFDTLKRFAITNNRQGLYFGLLADLPTADSPETEEDTPLLERALQRIEGLNTEYGNRFCLFVRRRSQGEKGKWNGKERKRGAIEELVRYLHRGEGSFLVTAGADTKGVKFLLSLDGDTNLPPRAVISLCGMALHPLNRPTVKNGRVKEGYGILQPAIGTALGSSKTTRFASLISGVGGIDVYESAAFNRQQSVFGEGIFCGKGLIDVAAYSKTLEGTLPEGRVLSHDMPEGNIMRTRYVSDLCFTDSAPSNVLAYYSRLHRWIRGDTQNLSLLFGYRQGARGGLRIIQNVLRHLCPVLSFAALCFAGFTVGGGRLWVCLFALLNLISPVFFTLVSRPAALRLRSRRFFSSVQSGLVQSVCTAFYESAALAYKAFITVDAVVRSLIRLATGKKLLSWVTAAQADKAADDSIISFIYRMFPSALAGSIFFFTSQLWVTRLLGLFWFLFPVYAQFLSLPIAKEKKLSKSLRKSIKQKALPIWSFFKDKVGEDTLHLPPDNVQTAPVEATALRTSPTNIGLYLLSVAAAELFDFISPKESAERIEKALGTIEKMDKWKGHLYNWYSLKNLEVLGGGYVSTVDSGNLCVCLVALSRFLYSKGRANSAKRAEALYERADFKALYNEERHLFSLGFDGINNTLSDICYDLYMSEARSTSYFALAFGQVGMKHWRSLGRPVIGNKGHIGMASWSGTAFEYFMPQLFLPLYKDSFIYESLHFALAEQKRFSHGKLWGISESAFLCFDADMNYQYKAHGVQSLALCRYMEKEAVLSPYSVYLSMCIAPNNALKTLNAYEAEGACGPYGLYEAIDCTGGSVIQSYMAHHMGMSLIACANACFDGAFVKYFMDHPNTGAYYELFQEKIPLGAQIQNANKERETEAKQSRGAVFAERLSEYDYARPVFQVLGRGANTIVVDSAGHVRLSTGDVTVNETHFTPHSAARSLSVMFCCGKEIYSAAPYGIKEGKFSFESAQGYGAHICSSADFSGRVKYYTDAAGCFITETKSDSAKSYALVFSFDVQLEKDRSFYAHPAFSRLFITASYDKENAALIYCKSARDGRNRLYMAVGLSDKKLGFEFETNKESYEAFSLYSPEDVLKPKYSNTTGVCVSPFCLIKTPPVSGGEIRLIVAVGHSKEECVQRLNASRRGGGKAGGSSVFGERENPLLKGIFYGKDKRQGAAVTNGELWGRGISGDFPIIAVLVKEFYQKDILFYIRFFKKLSTLGIRTELVFLVCEEEKYSSPTANAIKRLIRAEKCEGFSNQKGGIFFADGNDKNTLQLFKNAADCFTESYHNPFGESASAKAPTPYPNIIRHGIGEVLDGENKVCGGIYKNGVFTVDKTERLCMPFSYVLAGRAMGSVVNHGSLGYSFLGNSSLKRIAAFMADPYGGTDKGEVLYGFIDGKVYDLIACASKVDFGEGVAVYKGVVLEQAYTVRVFVCEKLALKVLRVQFDKGDGDSALCVKPLMGSGAFPARSICPVELKVKDAAAIGFKNGKSSFFKDSMGFIACLGTGRICKSEGELFGGDATSDEDAFAVRHKGKDAVYLIGASPSESAVIQQIKGFAKNGAEAEEQKARRFALSMLPPIQLTEVSASTAEMFCGFAPYQVAACRFFARGAFYQSSGAYGFRDQLQDCMYLVYSMPKVVRSHIIRAASRQYTDGGVQHWWHPNPSEGKTYGVRSKCSDDFLWLPICTSEYIKITGDNSILMEEISYLSSPELGEVKERYEAAERTKGKESLYMHCVRALEHGKNYGSHGIPLMGSCDWNDAFSDLGDAAESVFSGFLYVIALRRFGEIAESRGDGDYAKKCGDEAEALLKRCEACFEGDRFVRAYGGDGSPLGVVGRQSCEIDILCQAFAVFAGADKDKCRIAMKTAYELLFDRKNKLLRLFSPPFGADTEYAGYINAYAKGVRENGGQYTHAAVWFAAALAICGMKEQAKELMDAINPLHRAEDVELFSRYRAEPYAIAADIYTARGQQGRGGWSFYTGAAAWYCKVMLEQILGIRFSKAYRCLTVKPLMEYTACTEFFGKVTIEAKKDVALTMDGAPVSFPIILDGKEHHITVPVI